MTEAFYNSIKHRPKFLRFVVLYEILRSDGGRIKALWKAIGGLITGNPVRVKGWEWNY